MIDSHAHLDSERYDEDREEVIKRAFEGGLEKIINISSDFSSINKVMDIIEKNENIYGTIGIQPHSAYEFNDEVLKMIRTEASSKKILAIGEIGLDYHYNFSLPEIQRKVFSRQIEIAKDLNLPLVVHMREAFEDTVKLLKAGKADETGGVIHCFTEDEAKGMAFIDMGFYLGIGGAVTFKNTKLLQKAVKKIPLEKIILETDCPYMTPTPHRGKRNEPAYLLHIAEKIGELKEINPEEVKKQTLINTKKLFNL